MPMLSSSKHGNQKTRAVVEEEEEEHTQVAGVWACGGWCWCGRPASQSVIQSPRDSEWGVDVIGIGNEGKRDLSGMFRIITKLTVMPCLSTQSKRKSALASSSAPNNKLHPGSVVANLQTTKWLSRWLIVNIRYFERYLDNQSYRSSRSRRTNAGESHIVRVLFWLDCYIVTWSLCKEYPFVCWSFAFYSNLQVSPRKAFSLQLVLVVGTVFLCVYQVRTSVILIAVAVVSKV